LCHAAPSGAKRFCPSDPPDTFDGRIHYTRWTDHQDVERFGVEIVADEVTRPLSSNGADGRPVGMFRSLIFIGMIEQLSAGSDV
jgi:hypothetical protein